MMQFDRITLGKQARELGFVRDTFEKVCRLADILMFFQSDSLLSEKMALKGGTAICEISGINTDHLRQCSSRPTLCFSRCFYICPKSFKSRTIFNFRHIASPTYIVYFIFL